MREYLTLMDEVLTIGTPKNDRTGVGTHSLFGRQLRFNLNDGFPAVTTKKLQFKSVVYELLWFLRGETNVGWLNEHGVHIWDEWADQNGELGPVYGKQWRHWRGHNLGNADVAYDQINQAIYDLRTNPDSRRILVSAWNVAELGSMALQPCHVLFQFYVADNRLSLQMYQRSADVFLGLPFNIASYALLTHMVAQVCKLEVGELIICLGDAHLYNNHVEQASEQLQRAEYPKPRLWLNPNIVDISSFEFHDIELRGYQHHPAIKAPIAV